MAGVFIKDTYRVLLKGLSYEDAGVLFKALLAYVSGENDVPVPERLEPFYNFIISESPGNHEEVKEQKQKTGTKEYSPEFEELWKVYINKADKWSSFQKYEARRKSYSHEQLMTAVKNYCDDQIRNGSVKYTKCLKTFFSNDNADFVRFIDFIPEANVQEQDSRDDWADVFRGERAI